MKSHSTAVLLIISLVTVSLGVTYLREPFTVPAQQMATSGVLSRAESTVCVQVTDGARVTGFRYRTFVATDHPVHWDNTIPWNLCRSRRGEFRTSVPIPCQLTVEIDSLDHPQGYGRCRETFILKAGGSDHVTMTIERGKTVHGKVIDSQTKAPVSGARVMPLIFLPPIMIGDSPRSVVTDSEGLFSLRGVDGSLEVQHPEYLSETIYSLDESTTSSGLKVPLSRGPTAHGRVVDSLGQPLANVEVSSSGKQVFTGPDGTFELKGIGNHRSYFSFMFACSGYAKQWLNFDSVDKGMLITMTPVSQILGHVRTASDAPVTMFRVIAGPGDNPADFQCESVEVDDAQGRFSVSTDEAGKHWVGVRAKGFSPWEGWCNVQAGSAEINVSLTTGVSVNGSIQRPASSRGEITLKLIPQRLPGHAYIVSDTAAREIATETTLLRADDTFQFINVRPDRYQLVVLGTHITPVVRNTIVPAGDLLMGTLPVQGTGTVEGTVYDERTGLPVSYANGTWKLVGLDELIHGEFRAGVDGSYRINNAPAGVVQVHRPEHLTADIIGGEVRQALVRVDEVSTVHFADPDKGRDLSIRFQVGDGSTAAFERGTGASASFRVSNVTDRDPMFHLRLERLTAAVAAWSVPDWHSTVEGQITLQGVSPGNYRLHVGDWGGSSGFRENLTTVEFTKSEGSMQLIVPLGSGAITGKISHTDGNRCHIHMMAISEDRRTIRSTHSDETGAFCLRYLPAGKYRIFAHDELAGWAELTTTSIQENFAELPVYSLSLGATVEGTLLIADGATIPDRIEAIHESGIVLEVDDFVAHDGMPFKIKSLWPGLWTLRLMQGSTILHEEAVPISGTEISSLNLISQLETQP